MRITHKKNSKLMSTILQHIRDNLRTYLLVSCILLVGIILGVIFINNMGQTQKEEVQNYLNEFVNSLKGDSKIDNGKLLQNSIKNNVLLTLFMWFVGSTVIGIPLVLGMVLFRGFCLGYTISAVIAVWGTGKGILFFTTSLLLQNLIFIPCILALAVSGMKLYQSIMKDRRKENIKIEVLRHTLFSLVMLALLILASVIETYVSSNLFMTCVSYF